MGWEACSVPLGKLCVFFCLMCPPPCYCKQNYKAHASGSPVISGVAIWLYSFCIDLDWYTPQALASLNVSSGSSPSMTSSLSRSASSILVICCVGFFFFLIYFSPLSENTNRIFRMLLVLLLDKGQFTLEGASGGVWSNCWPQARSPQRLEQLAQCFILFGLKLSRMETGQRVWYCCQWMTYTQLYFLTFIFSRKRKKTKLVRILLSVLGITCFPTPPDFASRVTKTENMFQENTIGLETLSSLLVLSMLLFNA